MKKTWNGINRLINDKKNRKQVISSLKHPDDNSLTNDPLEISNIFNNYFSSVGKNLASRVLVHLAILPNTCLPIIIQALSSLTQLRQRKLSVRYF